jgi:hypothetical protein
MGGAMDALSDPWLLVTLILSGGVKPRPTPFTRTWYRRKAFERLESIMSIVLPCVKFWSLNVAHYGDIQLDDQILQCRQQQV